MTQQTMHPLAEQYLDELRRATHALPKAQQAELLEDITAHIEAGLAQAHTEADVRNLLESLGSPESVMAALDIAPAESVSAKTPLLLGLFSVATFLPGMAALWVPGVAFVSGALGLAASWTGVRSIRRARGTSTRTWPATIGALLGAGTVLTLLVFWTLLIAVFGQSQITSTRVVPASQSETSSLSDTVLQLRQVLSAEPANAGACPAPDAAPTDPRHSMSACSADGMTLYLLAPSPLTGLNVTSIAATAGSDADQSVIKVTLDAAGQASLVAMTTDLAGQPSPKSQMAVVIRGEVQTAPTVMEPLNNDTLLVSVPLSLQQANLLIAGLYGLS